MHDGTEGVNGLALKQNIDLDQSRLLLTRLLVIQAGVATGPRFQRVEEVEDDLTQRHGVAQLDTFRREIVHAAEFSPSRLAQFHDRADELTGCDDSALDHRLVDHRNLAVRPVRRVGDDLFGTVLGNHPIDHVGRGRDQIEVEFTLKTLTGDLHMQQTQKAAAEPKAQCH